MTNEQFYKSLQESADRAGGLDFCLACQCSCTPSEHGLCKECEREADQNAVEYLDEVRFIKQTNTDDLEVELLSTDGEKEADDNFWRD